MAKISIPAVDTHELAKLGWELANEAKGQARVVQLLSEEALVEAKTELLGKYDELKKQSDHLKSLLMHLIQASHHPKWSVRRAFRKKIKAWVKEGLSKAPEAEEGN